MHAAAAQGDKVACTRCGTTRQAHIQLHLQKCPVRGFFRGGAEDPTGTEVYAAWHRTVRAMHAHTKLQEAAGQAVPPAAADAEPAVALAAAGGGAGWRASCQAPTPCSEAVSFARHGQMCRGRVLHAVLHANSPALGESVESRMLRWQSPDRGLPAVHPGISFAVPGQLAPRARGPRPRACRCREGLEEQLSCQGPSPTQAKDAQRTPAEGWAPSVVGCTLRCRFG